MDGREQLCTFWVDGRLFGIEVSRVQEVIRTQAMTVVPLAPPVIRGLINLRGQIVAALDLRRRLGRPAAGEDAEPMNVVVQTDDGALSLLVDDIGDVIEVDPDRFEPPPETLQGLGRELVRGVYKLDEGLLLLLDAERVAAPTPTEREIGRAYA